MFQRPAEYHINKGNVFAELDQFVYHTNKETGELLDISLCGILVETYSDGSEEKILPIDPKLFTDETFNLFAKVLMQIGKCIRLAEISFDSLKKFVGLYLRDKALADVHKDFEKVDLNKADFMKYRDIMGKIIKKETKFHVITEINSMEKRLHFTSSFHAFITDRNYYTHGKPYFHYPTMVTILRVVDVDSKQEIYKLITPETITEYFKCFSFLAIILQKIYDKEFESVPKK